MTKLSRDSGASLCWTVLSDDPFFLEDLGWSSSQSCAITQSLWPLLGGRVLDFDFPPARPRHDRMDLNQPPSSVLDASLSPFPNLSVEMWSFAASFGLSLGNNAFPVLG